MQRITMNLTSLLLILAFGAQLGCPQVHLAQAREVRLPQSMKGYELYSWNDRGEWHFALLVGTNRLKTRDEVTSPQGRLKGLEAVKNKLNQLAKGEEVFWSSGIVRGTILPPEEIIRAVKSYCEERGILLRVPSRAGGQRINSPVKEDISAV